MVHYKILILLLSFATIALGNNHIITAFVITIVIILSDVHNNLLQDSYLKRIDKLQREIEEIKTKLPKPRTRKT